MLMLSKFHNKQMYEEFKMAVDPERSRGMRGNKNAVGPRRGVSKYVSKKVPNAMEVPGAMRGKKSSTLKLDMTDKPKITPTIPKVKPTTPKLSYSAPRAIASKAGLSASASSAVERAANKLQGKVNSAKSFVKANMATKGGNTKTKIDDNVYAAADKVKNTARKAKSFVKENMATKGKNTKTTLDDKAYRLADKARKKVKSWMS